MTDDKQMTAKDHVFMWSFIVGLIALGAVPGYIIGKTNGELSGMDLGHAESQYLIERYKEQSERDHDRYNGLLYSNLCGKDI